MVALPHVLLRGRRAMAGVNTRRVWLGALAGWVVWLIWSGVTNFAVLMPRYAAAQQAGTLLTQPPHPLFLVAGSAGGYPRAFSLASWSPFGRAIPFWWMLELWVGAILATLVAGWLYRD